LKWGGKTQVVVHPHAPQQFGLATSLGRLPRALCRWRLGVGGDLGGESSGGGGSGGGGLGRASGGTAGAG
jgi:hypothetical protein